MSTLLDSLVKFIQYKQKPSSNNHFGALDATLMQFVYSNIKLIQEFEKSASRTFDENLYNDVIKSTMPDEVLEHYKEGLFQISSDAGIYTFAVYYASYHDEPFYEYSHQFEVCPEELEDPQLAIDFPDSDGWKTDHKTGRGRSRKLEWYAKDKKSFKAWIPIVQEKLNQTFPNDLVVVRKYKEDFEGVEITISGIF
jgi:hypothetical protein